MLRLVITLVDVFHCRWRPPSPLALGAYSHPSSIPRDIKEPSTTSPLPSQKRVGRSARPLPWPLGEPRPRDGRDHADRPHARRPRRLEIVNEGIFGRYRDKLGAAIGVTLHMGNWELAIWPLTTSARQTPPAFIARSTTLTSMLYARAAQATCPGRLRPRQGEGDHERRSRTARITDFVRRGGRLGIVCDLTIGPESRAVLWPASTAQAIGAMIARRVGARIWMARCLRSARKAASRSRSRS